MAARTSQGTDHQAGSCGRRRPAGRPDPPARALPAWLREHPSVQIISRDRAGAYAEAADKAAPEAVQIADRWHLMKNAVDALERVLQRERRVLKEAATQAHRHTTPEPSPPAPGRH